MGEVAYRVRSGYDGFEGGDLAVGDGTFHLGEALTAGAGHVVVDEADSVLVIRLDEQPALERADVDAARRAVDAADRGLERMTRDELEQLAVDMSLDVDNVKGTGTGGKVTNPDLVSAIRGAREGASSAAEQVATENEV